MAVKTQDELIGAHPTDGSIFSNWLSNTEDQPKADIKHRKLDPDPAHLTDAIDKISDYLLIHHIPDSKVREIKVKKRILDKYGFTNYVNNIDVLPSSHATLVGNGTEVIMSEYLKKTSGLELLVYRLHYNPNVDQAMKGDDALLLNPENVAEKIIIGESKFRASPDKPMVEEILKTMGDISVTPISLSFIQNTLHKEGKNILAKEVAELQSNLAKNLTPIISVGFILSNHNTHNHITRNGTSLNRNLVFASIAITDPTDFLNACFDKAREKLDAIEKCSLTDFPMEYAADIVSAEVKQLFAKLKTLIA